MKILKSLRRRVPSYVLPQIELTLFKSSFWAAFMKRFGFATGPFSVCLFVCLSCMSVTLAYSGQAVRWIKMKLGTQVGFGPGHIVLDGNSALLKKKNGYNPPAQFPTHISCGQMAKWIRMPQVGLGPDC